MKRGELWIAALDKMRPVLILSTYTGLNDIQIIPATTRLRGLATEVEIGLANGVDARCVLNAQLLQLVRREVLSVKIGQLDSAELIDVCRAVKEAIGC